MYFHVCETQRTRMHVTDTTATPNGHQMAVVTWDRSIFHHKLILMQFHVIIIYVCEIIWLYQVFYKMRYAFQFSFCQLSNIIAIVVEGKQFSYILWGRKLLHTAMLGIGPLPWLHHGMEMISTLLAICEGNLPIIHGYPSQRTSKVDSSHKMWFPLTEGQ